MRISRAALRGVLAVLWLGTAAARAAPSADVANPDNPGVVTLEPRAYGKVIALSDVHGMYDQLLPLLRSGGVIDAQNHWAAGDALFILVGDSIDKGPDSVDIIDLWMSLSGQAAAAGGRVVVLMGNHEAEFLADPSGDAKAKAFTQELKGKGIPLAQVVDIDRPRGKFLRSLPVAARVGKWLFCHAGLLPDLAWDDFVSKAASVAQAGTYGDSFLIGSDSVLEARKWWADPSTRRPLEDRLTRNGLYGVVFGHQPGALNVEGADAISEDGRLIKIDTGMAPDAGAHPGALVVFPDPAQLDEAAPATVLTAPSGGAPGPIGPESLAPLKSAADEAP